METHDVLGGKAYVYKRDDSPYWQAATFHCDQKHRISTKRLSLESAIAFAENWYIGLHGKALAGTEATREPTFRDVAEMFLKEYGVLTLGERSPRWVEGHKIRLRLHLLPFFGDLPISKVTSGKVQEYRVMRMTPMTEKSPHSLDNRPFKPTTPARKTLHNEIITLRHVLKTAVRHEFLDALPDLALPYKAQSKVGHRAWFSPAEYKQLYEATRAYAKTAPAPVRWYAEQLHDYVLFMANTGIRPDEACNLQHRDVEVVEDEATGETILVIEVRGKTGIGYCKSTANAVRPYQRILNRPKRERNPDGSACLPKSIDPVFPSNQIKIFNSLLRRIGLKVDRDGNPRTAYSLRHTYICLRLMEGADIYQIAKNCRTSVEMIEKHYARHIKNTLDAAAINVRKTGQSRAPIQPPDEEAPV